MPTLQLSSLPPQGKSGNPSCLCNLLPAPGGFRRQGLWAKQADVLGTLGRDPAETKRKVRGGLLRGHSACAVAAAACGAPPAPSAVPGLWVLLLSGVPSSCARLFLLQDRSKPVGLKNLGNTCYVNSVLQVRP